MNIYVGNLASDVTDQDLRSAFEEYGVVETVTILKDRYTNESRGFGFVEMRIKTEAEEAIKKLDGSEMKGKSIIVNEARKKKENKRHGRGGSGGGFRRF
ncbi:RNA-binding protein [candidate division KSB1 bacterium 4484_188]|nr:MAG: RNA-binding protein [candidate division KSB1 bacterium 4484_188]HFE65179.1 RNA-binding protein [Caldithrix sp.]